MDIMLYDGLTGAYTRALLDVRLQKEISRATRRHTNLSLILIDLDYFKSINDAFGHARGDQALMELVSCIKSNMRDSDDVFRYGGDEFVLMLPETDISQAVILASRIMNAIQAQPISGNPPISLSCSIGIASFPEDANTPQSLFDVADRRHYRAKAFGRGRMIWQDDGWLKKTELKPPDRIIARDESLEAFRAFMDSFAEKRLGEFYVNGISGVGKTRYLQELRNIARLRGYAVLFLEGAPALHSRFYGALQECLQHWQNVDIPFDPPGLTSLLKEVIDRKQLTGLVIFMDDWQLIDEATLALIGGLTQSMPFERLALVYAGDGRGKRPFSLVVPELHAETILQPLAEMDVKIWLRYVLELEPEDGFINALQGKAHGLPRQLDSMLQWLHRQKIIKRGSQAWEVDLKKVQAALDQFSSPPILPPNNLELPLPGLIGRDDEILLLHKLISEHRLVTVLGQAGVGKFHLSRQAALESHRRFPDGIFAMEMGTGRSQDTLISLLANELEDQHWPVPLPVNTFFNNISNKKMLLLLVARDETSLDPRFVQTLLARTSALHVLVVSQVRLGLPTEQVFELGPLRCPVEGIPSAGMTPAEEFFLYYARQAVPDFEDDPEQVARVCRAVGGLPLALELAASWVKALNCQQIANQLEESVSLLAETVPGQLASQRSLLAMFDSFMAQLSSQEQIVFSNLSVFEDTFSSRAAQEVTGASAFFLDALVARSMLITHDNRRYRLHVSLRRFLMEKFKANVTVAKKVEEKHGTYYIKKFIAAQGASNHSGGFADYDLHNLRKAWYWTIQHSQMQQVEEALLPLANYLRNRGLFREVLDSFNFIYQLLEDVPDSYRDNLLIARTLCVMGECHDLLGEYAEGQEVLEKALGLARVMGSVRDEAEITRSLASIHSSRGEYDLAETLNRNGLELAEQAGEKDLLFLFQNSLAVLAYMRGSYREAIPFCEAALEIAREANDKTRIAQSLNNLGHMYFSLGELEQARPYLAESLTLLDQVPSQTMRGSILDTMGKIQTATSDFDEARQTFARSLVIMAEMQSVPLVVEVLVSVAEMWASMGRDDLALSSVDALVNQPVSHDIGLRAARLRAALTKKRVKPSQYSWKSGPLPRMITDVLSLLESRE